MKLRLSEPQQTLLAEIESLGGLYVRRYSRYARTVQVLERMGLVRCDERDYSGFGSDHYVAVCAREEAEG